MTRRIHIGGDPRLSRRRRVGPAFAGLLAGLASLLIVGCGSSASATSTSAPIVPGADRSTSTAAPASATSSVASSSTEGSASTAGASGRATLHSYTVTSGGIARTYLLQVPVHAGASMPLVAVLGGAGATAQSIYGSTDFASVGASQGYLVAYPQGYDDTWNEGAGGTPARRAGVDDVAFFAAMTRQIESRYPVDRAHIAAAGISNGALMVQYLGCQLAATIHVIEPVEGELPTSVAANCHPSRPVSVLEVHGTADASIPYSGGHFDGVGGGTTVLSAPHSVAKWAGLDHCSARPSNTTTGGRRITRYGGCRSGASVQLLTIVGGTHDWPSDAASLLAGAL